MDAEEAEMKARMLCLLKRNTLYTNPYFDKVITWSHDPQRHSQPPIDYQLALINQSRERIEALTIDRELTLRALKSIPHLTDERIWANINLGLRMLPDHCPDIDHMTGTFVEITMHVRELKALIWRVESATRHSWEMAPWREEDREGGGGDRGGEGGRGGSGEDVGYDEEPAVLGAAEEHGCGPKTREAQCDTREGVKDKVVTALEDRLLTPDIRTEEAGFSPHDIRKDHEVTVAEQDLHIPTYAPARESVDSTRGTVFANKKQQEEYNIHIQKKIVKLAAEQAALFASTQISEDDNKSNADDEENEDTNIDEGFNMIGDHPSEGGSGAPVRNQIMAEGQISLIRQAAEEAALFAANLSNGNNIDDEVQTQLVPVASNQPTDATTETIIEGNETFDESLMDDAQWVILHLAAEGAARYAAEIMPKDGYEKTLAKDMQRAIIKRAAERAAGLAARFEVEQGDDEKSSLTGVGSKTETQNVLDSPDASPIEEAMGETEKIHNVERCEAGCIQEDRRSLARFAAEEAAAFAVTLMGQTESEGNDNNVEIEREAASIDAEEVFQAQFVDDDQKAIVKHAAKEAAAFAVALMEQAKSEGNSYVVVGGEAASVGVGEVFGPDPVGDDQKAIVKHAAEEAASFAATFITLTDSEDENGGCGKGLDDRYAEVWKGNGVPWVIIGTYSSRATYDDGYEGLCESLSPLGPTSYDENWVDEEMERDNEELRKNGYCVA